MFDCVEISLNAHRLLAAFDGNKLHDLLLIGDGREDIGAIYMARVERPVKGLGGVFVTYDNKKKGFWRIKNPPREGALVALQIAQSAQNGKPPRFTDKIDFRGPFAVLTPDRPGVNVSRDWKSKPSSEFLASMASTLPKEAGLILRTSAEHASEVEIANEIENLVSQYQKINSAQTVGIISQASIGIERAKEEWGAVNLSQNLEDYQKDALHDALSLPKTVRGGLVQIDQTQALIAVDIDTGANTSLTGGRDVNMAACHEILRWLSLMGWGGQLLVDLAPMPKNLRKNFENAMLKASKANRVAMIARGFGPLGLFEAQIRYGRRPLPVDLLVQLGLAEASNQES